MSFNITLPSPPDDERTDVRVWRYLLRQSLEDILGAMGTSIVNITGSRGQHPDDIPSSPDVADDEFEGATIDTTGTRTSGATPWEWHNQDDATATLTQGHLVLKDPGNSVLDLHILRQEAPVAPWVFRFKFSDIAAANSNYAVGGVVVMKSTGKFLAFTKDYHGGWDWSLDRYPDVNSAPTAVTGAAGVFGNYSVRVEWYVEVENDGTDLIFRWSNSGVNGSFTELGRDPIASFVDTADYIGLVVGSLNSSDVSIVVEWWRRFD